MGGLVVKEALILGSLNPAHQPVIKNVKAVVFLATPHRGSAFAEILNMLLKHSPLNHSPKVYVNELQKNSPRLQEINENFRHVGAQIQLVSFYETIQTSVGPRKLVRERPYSLISLLNIFQTIVEKSSSILDWPNEDSIPMNADHHSICKYNTREDPSYSRVRDEIRSLVLRFSQKGKLLAVNTSLLFH
jgi:hypothetical protein